jgi:hypothetical protein
MHVYKLLLINTQCAVRAFMNSLVQIMFRKLIKNLRKDFLKIKEPWRENPRMKVCFLF